MSTETQTSTPAKIAESPPWSGRNVGAITAAVLCFSMVMIPATIFAVTSPAAAGWWPVILICALPWTAIAAIVGALIGRFAARTTNATAGTVIGIAISFPIGCIAARVLCSPIEPCETFIGTIVHAIVPGAFAGAVVALLARSTQSGLRISLADAALFIGLLAVPGVYYGHLHLESRAQSQIIRVGGAITWNAIVDRRGAWEVTLQGERVGDAELEEVAPTLARYPRLDLDLGHSRVTDAGLSHLGGLSNLFRIRLYGTAVSDDGVARLKQDLPKLEVLREFTGY